MKCKPADICSCLNPSPSLKSKIRTQIGSLPSTGKAINQTLSSPVRYVPIALGIVTKLPFCGDEATKVQLATWVGAGIEKLRKMMSGGETDGTKEKKEIPPMPGLSFHGHDLYMVVFHEEEKKNIMYGKVRLGSTDTITGVFQVLAALDVLVNWARNDYRKWFEEAT